MEIDEVAARVFRRYWQVVLAAVLLPVALVAAFYAGQPRTYAATARLVASDTLPKSAAEADAVVSEARAFATTRNVVDSAIADAKVDRRADDVLPRISVSGLGSSPLVDVSVSDGDAAVSRTLTQALANHVVKQLNTSRLGTAQAVLRNVDSQLTQLATRRAPLAAAADAAPQDQAAQSRLAAVDRLISDLAADRNNLSLQAAATGQPRLVEDAQQPTAPQPRSLIPRLALALLLGLVIGVAVSAVLETARPTVPGPGRVARMLGVPMLGRIFGTTGATDLGLRLRLAAAKAEVSTAVLVGTGRKPIPVEFAEAVAATAVASVPEYDGLDSPTVRLTAPTAQDDRERANGEAVASLPSRLSGQRLSGRGAGQLLTEQSSADLGTDSAAGWGRQGRASTGRVALERVCRLEDLDTAASARTEAAAIGLVVVAGSITRLSAVDAVRDLQSASGWPVLGVVAEHRKRGKGARS
jgi:capsular polysaccharide biosynthesis protein